MIAFSAAVHKGERNHIYVMDDDGHHLRCLTCVYDLPYYFWDLTWLPDEQHLLFAVSSDPPVPRYYVTDSYGVALRPFMPELRPTVIWRVTPDRHIFFGTGSKVWIAPVDGTLTDCVELIVEGKLTTVSPDGRWITFVREENPGCVYLQEVGTSDVQLLVLDDPTTEHYTEPDTVEWAPDAQKIAYIANYYELWVMNIAGSKRHEVGDVSYFWRRFRWSPDSKYISFIRSLDHGGPGTSYGGIYITNVDTTEERHLVNIYGNDGTSGDWVWFPSGKHVLYITYTHDNTQMYIIDVYDQSQHALAEIEQPFEAIYSIAVS